MNGREELLDEMEGDEERGDETPFFVVTVLGMLLVLALILPKIYVSATIYTTSLAIERYKADLLSLSEENKEFKRRLEVMRFENQDAGGL